MLTPEDLGIVPINRLNGNGARNGLKLPATFAAPFSASAVASSAPAATASSQRMTCSLGHKNSRPCGPQLYPGLPLQTLAELDASSVFFETQQTVKVSWIVLSRVGINFLANPQTYSHLTVCTYHKKELYEAWSPENRCCYPGPCSSATSTETV